MTGRFHTDYEFIRLTEFLHNGKQIVETFMIIFKIKCFFQDIAVALQIECKKIANKIQKTLMSLPTSVFQFVHIYSFTLHKNQPNVKVIR